jgi:hypothetical protein
MSFTTLRIASPCHESWAAMTPTSTGRHCAACQKTVVDFSQKTDAEILAALRQATGETCGRLRADQLGRPLVVPISAPRWRAWLGVVLAASSVLSASKTLAQASSRHTSKRPAPVANQPAGHARRLVTGAPMLLHDDGLMVLRGTVIDSTSHDPIPGVTVLLKGTKTGISTDASGAFSLSVAAEAAPVHLVFSSIGYISEERAVMPGQPISVALAADTHMLGEMGVVIAGGISQRPWPWHPRRFFNWSKYWVTRPFRS